ncbi:MAG: hypothetical protein ACTS3F_09645 [Phycisphaerales bacterium]
MGHDATPILDALRRVRSRARWLLVARRIGLMAAVALSAGLAFALLDFLVRFPPAVRAMVLILGVAALSAAWWRGVVPALRFRPSLTSIALRVEAIHPRLAGVLGSAVDFEASKGERGRRATETEAALAQRVIDDAARLFGRDGARGVLKPKPAMVGSGLGAFALLGVLVPLLVVPSMWLIGAERVLWPWGGAAWPKRTGVVDVTTTEVHPLGVALPLRAVLTRSPRGPEASDVAVRIRRIVDGDAEASRRLMLSYQGRGVGADREGSDTGWLFERLIEPVGEGVEYRFETDDDATEWRRIRLVPPPAVVRARATITPPDYALGVGAALGDDREDSLSDDGEDVTIERTLSSIAEVDLGTGLDERAIAPQALAGAAVRLELTLNKDASLVGWPDVLAAEPGIEAGSIAIDDAGDVVVVRFRLAGAARVVAALIDEHGIGSSEDAVFRFGAVEDRPATSAVVEPPRDRTALPTAVLGVVAEGRDDVSLSAVWLERQRFVPAGGEDGRPSGPGGAVEAIGEPVRTGEISAIGLRVARSEIVLDLSSMDVSPGDEVRLHALASDIYAGSDGVLREPARSAARIVRIIDEMAFVEEIRASLDDVREAAIRMDRDQRALREGLGRSGAEADAQTMREQARLTQRVARQEQALNDLEGRIEENRLDDAGLADLLGDAVDALREAGGASGRASEALDNAQSDASRRIGEAGEDPAEQDEAAQLTPEERSEIQRAQDNVEAELQRLIETLDTGQDTWVVRNALERMAREQRGLESRTQSLGQRTAGLTPEELGADERSELERIVEAQDELARQMEELLDQMSDRAEALEQSDPQAAQGLRQAAQRGEEERIEQEMRSAAQQAQQNQMTQAGQRQQQAAEAMEDMLEDLEGNEEQRAEVLRRVLRSVIESLDRLIADQRLALDELEKGEAGGSLDGLDEAMIGLFRNTLGVVDLIRNSGAELAAVGSLVGKASDAQSQAVAALRSEGELAAIAEDARGHERRSLELLIEARQRAEQLDEQIEQEQQRRKRARLRQAYRAALEEQVLLRDESRVFAELERLSRRDRIEVRQLGERQELLRTTVEGLLGEVEELNDAAVFVFTHDRLDAAMGDASRTLEEVEPASAIGAQERSIAMLQGLVQSLAESRPDGDFDDQQASGGGGGAGGQGEEQPVIPPLAELKLLRQLQGVLRDETSAAADAALEGRRFEGVDRLALDQRKLNELAEELLEKAQAAGGGGGGTGGQMPELRPPDPDGPGIFDPPGGEEEQSGPGSDSPLEPVGEPVDPGQSGGDREGGSR